MCFPRLHFGHTKNGFHKNDKKITSVRNRKRADSPTVRDNNDMENARICQDRTTIVFLALMIDGNRLGKWAAFVWATVCGTQCNDTRKGWEILPLLI